MLIASSTCLLSSLMLVGSKCADLPRTPHQPPCHRVCRTAPHLLLINSEEEPLVAARKMQHTLCGTRSRKQAGACNSSIKCNMGGGAHAWTPVSRHTFKCLDLPHNFHTLLLLYAHPLTLHFLQSPCFLTQLCMCTYMSVFVLMRFARHHSRSFPHT
jgi:hypothetical protein